MAKIRLASYCTVENVEQSARIMRAYDNKATKFIFIAMVKSKWTGGDTIKVPIAEFAPAVWMTYLLRTPSNKGNVKRDKQGNKIVDKEKKKCIRDTDPSYFTALSDTEKEARCMTIVKHLRKYFDIVDCKTEWTVTHSTFATAISLSEEVIESILPGSNKVQKKKVDEDSSVTTTRTRSKRKRGESEEESSLAKAENQKRRRMSGDSDVFSSVSSSYSSSLVSSPDSTYNPASPAEDLEQVASPLTLDTYGDFPTDPHQQLEWYMSNNNNGNMYGYFPGYY